MRAKGNLRLLLNARLWVEMQVTRMEGGKVGSMEGSFCWMAMSCVGVCRVRCSSRCARSFVLFCAGSYICCDQPRCCT